MSKPLLPWNSGDDGAHPDLVYRRTLDDRYIIEVQRIDERQGKLRVFDHERGDCEIASWDVGLSYGALFGPDADDVREWQERVVNFVDEEYEEE